MSQLPEYFLFEQVLTDENNTTYEQLAETIVELGNRMLEEDESAEVWEVASGMLAGAIQFWLYSRQPGDDPFSQTCVDISDAESRLRALLNETRNVAEESDYLSSPRDFLTGTA